MGRRFQEPRFCSFVAGRLPLDPGWAVAVEEYDDIGPLRDFYPRDEQAHELWGVFDRYSKPVDVEGGIDSGSRRGQTR